MRKTNLFLSFIAGTLFMVLLSVANVNLSPKYLLNKAVIGSPLAITQDQRATEQQVASIAAQESSSVVSVNIIKDEPIGQVGTVFDQGFDPLRGWFYDGASPAMQKQKIGAGSGFLVSSDGYILTNKHVVDDTGASYTVTLSDGTEVSADVVYKDPNYDLAVLKIAGSGYKPATLGDSSTVKPGQAVIGIGNALGEFSDTVTAGMVSGLNRSITAYSTDQNERLTGLIQSNAKMYPGDSGSPLFDVNGNVIGINVAIAEGTDISFTIPINIAKQVLTKENISANINY